MSSGSLNIPSKFLEDKSLSPAQKIILSYISQNQNSYLPNIAKGIGTKRSIIQDEIKQLVDQNKLFTSNGNGRVKYSTIKGLGIESNPITNSNHETIYSFSKKNYTTTKNNNIKQSKGKLLYSFGIGDSAVKAVEYWIANGGVKHRAGSNVYERSIESLIKLFSGTAFKHVHDSTIYNPKINKLKKFNLTDWMSAIDHLNLATTEKKYKPYNKDSLIKYRKTLQLPIFIYNPFSKEGVTRSMFLKYVKGPELLHQEKEIYPELTNILSKAFSKANLNLKPNSAQIVSIANKLPPLAKRHNWKWVSKADAVKVFMQFIMDHFGSLRYSPYYMTSSWFIFEFEKHLDRQGLITLYE
jgi:hypothetical protein